MLSRRDFLKSSFCVGTAAVALPLLKTERAEAADEMVKPTDANAVALNYQEDANKVDVKKNPKRAGAEGKKQFCWNCQYYQAKGADPKKEAHAGCMLFAGKHVKGAGWCTSWTQNPKITAK